MIERILFHCIVILDEQCPLSRLSSFSYHLLSSVFTRKSLKPFYEHLYNTIEITETALFYHGMHVQVVFLDVLSYAYCISIAAPKEHGRSIVFFVGIHLHSCKQKSWQRCSNFVKKYYLYKMLNNNDFHSWCKFARFIFTAFHKISRNPELWDENFVNWPNLSFSDRKENRLRSRRNLSFKLRSQVVRSTP